MRLKFDFKIAIVFVSMLFSLVSEATISGSSNKIDKVIKKDEIELEVDLARKLYGEKKYRKGFNHLVNAANKGSDRAQLYLYYVFKGGIGVEVDNEESFKWILRSARSGNVDAQGQIIFALEIKKNITEEEKNEAYELMINAVKSYDSYAINSLAYCYNVGFLVEKNYEKAYENYLKAAELGACYSFREIARLYQRGLIVPVDFQKVFEFYEKARECGDPIAQATMEAIDKSSDGIKIIFRNLGTASDEVIIEMTESVFNFVKEKKEMFYGIQEKMNLLKEESNPLLLEKLTTEIETLEMEVECPLCLETYMDKEFTALGCHTDRKREEGGPAPIHLFCKSCIDQALKESDKARCPLCRLKKCDTDQYWITIEEFMKKEKRKREVEEECQAKEVKLE